jgi:hypothetical protein
MCFAVMRRSALASVRPLQMFPGSDRLQFAELALRGRFVRAPETLFFNRGHVDRSSWKSFDSFYRDAGIEGPRAVRLHYWRQLWWVLRHADIAPAARARARLRLLAFTVRISPSLARSAASGTRYHVRRRRAAKG